MSNRIKNLYLRLDQKEITLPTEIFRPFLDLAVAINDECGKTHDELPCVIGEGHHLSNLALWTLDKFYSDIAQ